MTSTISRSVLILGMLATALVIGGRAQGQTGGAIGTGTGGATGSAALAASDFTILFESYVNGQWVQMNSTTQQYYFNQARCLCDTDPAGEFRIVVLPAAGAAQKIMTQLESGLMDGQGVAYLFASTLGADCLNPAAYVGGLAYYCTNLISPGSGYMGTTFSSMAAFTNVPSLTSPPIPVAYLFNSVAPPACGYTGTCDSAALCKTMVTETNVQFWAQTNSGVGPDFDPGPTATVDLVGYVPVAPADVVANGGNEALEVSWDWGSVDITTETTLIGVQLFCQRGVDTQVFPTGTFGPAYLTPAMLCPNSSAAASTTTGGPFSDFDPKYLCSGLIPAASTSHRITGLQNGTVYSVGVAAVDKFGNIGANTNVMYAVPGAGTSGTGGTLGTGGSGGSTGSPDAGMGGTGGTPGAGGSAGGPDVEATGGALGSGGIAGVSPPDGAAGVADAGTGARLANGCSCDIRGKHDRRETAGISWLVAVALAFAFKSRRSRPQVACRRQATD